MPENIEKKRVVVTVQHGGRIQIPKDLRHEMRIEDGDFVMLSLRKMEMIEVKEEASGE